jgi:uncharacterized protein YebE (UPF0316 family)
MINIVKYSSLVIFTLGIFCGMAIESSDLWFAIAMGVVTVPVIITEMRLLDKGEIKRGVKGVKVIMGEPLDGD